MTENIRQVTENIYKCKKCYLHKNGKMVPYVGEYAKNILLLDFIKHDMDKCMDKFWELFKKMGLSKQEFVVMYTTQCMTKSSTRGGKIHTPPPSVSHREECRSWLFEFLCEFEDPKMLVMGNVAMEHITDTFDGIAELNSTVIKPKLCGHVIPCVLSVSPSYLRKFGPGEEMIKKSLGVFKNL